MCEQTLVTLLHKMGPWRKCVFLVGGMAPRYLFPESHHAGTTDLDLVVSFDLVAETEAYRKLEKNLKEMGFARSVERAIRTKVRCWLSERSPRARSAAPTVDRFKNAAYDFVIEGESYRPKLKPKIEMTDPPLRTLMEIIKLRKLLPHVRQERAALMETYLAAFGISDDE